MKNRLWEEYGDPAKDLQTRAALVQKLHVQSEAHVDYDLTRDQAQDAVQKPLERAVNAMKGLASSLTNAEFILLNIDSGKVGGLAHEAILAPIKGVGKYAGQGESGKGADMIALSKHFDKSVVDVIGKADWEKMNNTFVDIPEFKGNMKLGDGRLSIGNLFMMMLNGGNEGNVQRMSENFGTDIETIRAVLDTHLDSKYAVAAQNIMHIYESYYPRVVKLHEEMTGVTPEMVEAVPFTHKGKVYPGGYYRLNYAPDLTPEKIAKSTNDVLASLNGDKEFSMKDHFYTDDMTRHGHTERRTSNENQIDLSMNSIGRGFEEVIHDLNFRKPLANAMKIVTDKTVAQDFSAIVGPKDFKVLVNTIVGAAGSLQMDNNRMYDATVGSPIVNRVRSGFTVGVLSYNASTFLIQPVSLAFSMKKMGLTAPKHFLAVTGAMLKDYRNFGEFVKFAGEIAPTVRDHAEGINENLRDAISEKVPPRNANKFTAGFTKIQSKLTETAFDWLGMPDQMMKVLVSMSAYRQFMEGDAPGYSRDTVNAMSQTERDHQAKVYASSVTRTTLTAGSKTDRAQVQHDYKNLALFFNDARNIINNTMQSGREIRGNYRRGNYTQSATEAAGVFLTLAMVKSYEDLIRGNATPATAEEGEDQESWVGYFAKAPFQVALQSLPVVRDINFAVTAFNGERDPNVTGFYGKVATDIAYTVRAATNFMDYIDGKELRKKDAKAIAMTASYLTGGLPVNGAFKFAGYVEKATEFAETYQPSMIDEFVRKFEAFKSKQESLPASEQVSQEEMDALDEIARKVAPQEVGENSIPEVMEKIKAATSGGDKYSKSPTSTAAGLYQFTEGTWLDIMARAPQLGLTIEGRVAENTEQQEKAMEWYTEQNASALSQAEIESSPANLYAAHILGAENAVKVLNAPADTKIRTLIPESDMQDYGFGKNMKVKSFKTWTTRKVNRESVEVATLDN